MGCLGTMQVVRKKRKPGKNINWVASIRYRDDLISRNIKILKYSVDDNNNLVSNGGESWFIYYTSDEAYWLIWDRKNQTFFTKEKYPLFPYYNFLFTKGEHEKGVILRLVRTWQEDKFVHLKYQKR